ncbi:MAG TPA: efflux RND transporter periplasmic adaptor subunit [Verrucomicrobiae bacterium]|nr:efflux RND transporter periplasmic adaptor subunit [Verrucomicrobiae bacterium]
MNQYPRQLTPNRLHSAKVFACVVTAGFLMLLSSCSQAPSVSETQSPAVPEVSVAMAIGTNTPVALEAIGHATPISSIAIRSQINGLLESVHFGEGELVKTGQLMFTIDSRPFSDRMAHAKSDLARDAQVQAQAAIEQNENAVLLQNRIVSKDSYNESAANAASLKAAFEADKAAVDLAELELSYCQIRSSIAGRAGFLQVSPGNVIPGPETVLVTVNQTQPIFVDFPIPEAYLPSLREALNRGPIEVRATAQGQQSRWTGTLLTIDNAVDETTHTVLLRARFANNKEELWPGQSVNIAFRTGGTTSAALVPAAALWKRPEGQFVFVVRRDETIEERLVEGSGLLAGGDAYGELVTCRGVEPGECVVTRATLPLVQGQKVLVVNPEPRQERMTRTVSEFRATKQ